MSYERKDASPKVIGVSAAVLAFLVLASIAGSSWLYQARYHGPGARPTAGRAGSFRHGPDQKIPILVDYAAVTRSATRHLEGYGWADDRHQIARIPIERAMALVAAGAKPAPAPKQPGQVP